MLYKDIASAYHSFLTSVAWDNPLYVKAITEGKNKFLSNAWLSLSKSSKYHKAEFITKSALAKIENGDYKNLVFEHMIPKQKFIQKPCEELAKKGELTLEFVEDILTRYWHLATITKEEDSMLDRLSIPSDWDKKDIFIRYKIAQIDLIENPYYFWNSSEFNG